MFQTTARYHHTVCSLHLDQQKHKGKWGCGSIKFLCCSENKNSPQNFFSVNLLFWVLSFFNDNKIVEALKERFDWERVTIFWGLNNSHFFLFVFCFVCFSHFHLSFPRLSFYFIFFRFLTGHHFCVWKAFNIILLFFSLSLIQKIRLGEIFVTSPNNWLDEKQKIDKEVRSVVRKNVRRPIRLA